MTLQTQEKLIKILKGAGIAAVGAALTYLTEALPTVELGDWTPVVVGAWSIVVNVLRKLIAGDPVKGK